MRIPPPIAPLASWSWRTSSCVRTISPPPAAAPWGTRIRRRSSPRWASRAAKAAGKRSRRSIWMSPVQSTRPTSSAAATASISPEPQMPWGAPSPITWKRRSPSSTQTRSMAPTAPRIPWRICAPSSAGPAGAEQAISRSRVPITTSPFVPMSTTARTPTLSSSRVARAAPTASAPTKPATMGRKQTRASGLTLRWSVRAGSTSGCRTTAE